ncbi:MAG: SUMF1/EgtB/PvdO family nonheme iron enzyme, partial [Polyangiaceae bacterium]|nr:SUMF1/EgtB/PvdO family nonheme iron enzyme [Polyangiaceae bacterium]
RQRLEAAATEWERLGRTREELWSARQLAEAASIRKEELQPREIEFLRASRNAVRLRKVARNALILGVPLLVGLVYTGIELKARRDLDRKIAADLARAKIAIAEAQIKNDETKQLREEALARFDARDTARGEAIWTKAIASADETARAFSDASQVLEAALVLDSSRVPIRDLLGDLLYERALVAERSNQIAQRDELLNRLVLYDESGKRRAKWSAPAVLTVNASPGAERVHLQRFVSDKERFRLEDARDLGPTPVAPAEIPPGSYVIVVSAPDRVEVRYPVVLARGEKLDIQLDLPTADAIPPGFVYVPAGRFLVGTGENEHLRHFLSTSPIHEARTDAFLIARYETTFADWIDFLTALSPAERAERTPKVGGVRGSLELKELPNRQWELLIQPTTQAFRAKSSEMMQYPSRDRRASQNWLRFPVTGISTADAEAYVAWLRTSGKVPGARMCSEHEWERAARGADDREYPHGHSLAPDDANIDVTYGKDPATFGLDEVGSHPVSRSPFGLDDLSGNAWEWTKATLSKDDYAVRGGGYYFDATSARTTNRYLTEATLRDITVGVRVCATVPSR